MMSKHTKISDEETADWRIPVGVFRASTKTGANWRRAPRGRTAN